MDLSKLNLAELKDLQAQVVLEMKSREKSEVEKARNDIKAIAESLGMSLKDLLGSAETKIKVRKQTGKVAVQYRNPQDTSQEWTGRGRQPRWVKELLASGKNLLSAKVSG
jgi:DNA-binding protein H-NS